MKTKLSFMIKKVWIAAAFILCAFLLVSCSQGPYETEIASARIKGDEIEINVTLDKTYIEEHRGEQVYLFALPSAYTDDISDHILIGSSSVKASMDFYVPVEKDGYSLISSAFVLVEEISTDENGASGVYAAVTAPKYIKNPEKGADYSSSPSEKSAIKGLQPTDVFEAEYFGAEHVLFEVDIAKAVLAEYEEGAVNHIYQGSSYYFSGEMISALDKQIAEASALDLRIYLRTVLGGDKLSDSTLSDLLYCRSANRGKEGYLPNLSNYRSAGYIAAFYDMLATRYANEECNVLDYIIGNSANDFTEYCNAGSYSKERFQADYFSWMRTAYSVLASHAENVNVYASCDNTWRADGDNICGTKAFLTSLTELSQKAGDFSWSIAINMGFGEDLSAVLSGESGENAIMGINDIPDLITLLQKEEMLYGEHSRRIIIDSIALPNSISESNRAAYYTYAFYKAAESGIDAIIYNSAAENCGLKSASGARSSLYFSFLMCESNITAQLGDYTNKIANSSIPDFSQYKARQLTFEQSVANEVSGAIRKNREELPADITSAAPGGSCFNVEFSNQKDAEGNHYRTLTAYTNTLSDIGYFSILDIPARDMLESGYVGIKMYSDKPLKAALVITNKGNKLSAYVGEVSLTDQPTDYYFKTSEFTDHMSSSDSLQLSICIFPDGEDEIKSVSIEDIALYGSSGNGSGTLITILGVILATIGIGVLLFWLSKRRKARQNRYDD